MCSGKQRGDVQVLLASEDAVDEPGIISVIEGDPTNIKDVVNLPGEEGKAWEIACQAEWKNMLDHNIFSPPEIPTP